MAPATKRKVNTPKRALAASKNTESKKPRLSANKKTSVPSGPSTKTTTRALKVPASLSTKFLKQLARVSDWRVAQEKAYAYLGKEHGTLFASPRKDKKYAVLSPDNRVVSFGAIDYEDFTKHKDTKRRQNYLRRASNISGNWRENKFSPNNLAIHILW